MTKILLFVTGLASTVLVFVFIAFFFTRIQLHTENLSKSDQVTAEELRSNSPDDFVSDLHIDQIFTMHPLEMYPEDAVRIMMTGDIIPARMTDLRMRKKGMDYPFSQVSAVLQDADLTVTNLESPLLSNCPPRSEGMQFCGQKAFAPAMKQAGIGLVGLENNHIGNYGVNGIAETKDYLKEAGLGYVRSDAVYFTEIKNNRFAFLAYNFVGVKADTEALTTSIQSARAKADVVVVMPHWGREYTAFPDSAPGLAPDNPITLGHLMIDSGADLVLGNHPHWVQGVEKYHNGFIAYAHGNFIFDQNWSKETMQGVIGQYIFSNKKLRAVSYLPIVIDDSAVPRRATDSEAVEILERMKLSSQKLALSE